LSGVPRFVFFPPIQSIGTVSRVRGLDPINMVGVGCEEGTRPPPKKCFLLNLKNFSLWSNQQCFWSPPLGKDFWGQQGFWGGLRKNGMIFNGCFPLVKNTFLGPNSAGTKFPPKFGSLYNKKVVPRNQLWAPMCGPLGPAKGKFGGWIIMQIQCETEKSLGGGGWRERGFE